MLACFVNSQLKKTVTKDIRPWRKPCFKGVSLFHQNPPLPPPSQLPALQNRKRSVGWQARNPPNLLGGGGGGSDQTTRTAATLRTVLTITCRGQRCPAHCRFVSTPQNQYVRKPKSLPCKLDATQSPLQTLNPDNLQSCFLP